ncbi:MAG: F0F1 ATP synthase subunit A [Bacteroidales bacterium]|nr:F0F1 ATP synthase subunit A [Bacteroidales bacterium]MCF8402884.1 F0F1 ATP synthase subunit A [Bacteroidales bacterium]
MIINKTQVRFLLKSSIIIGLLLFSFQLNLLAEEEVHNTEAETHHEDEGFNPGTMIVEHIIDAHEWHIMNIGHTHVSVPLPVILFHDGHLVVFMSSKFEHGHAEYKGYKLELEGENKGKIVHVESGELPLDISITKNVFAMLFSMLLICIIFISIGKSYSKRKGMAPKGLQSLLEPLIIFIRDDVAKASIGEKKYEKYLPFLLTLFFFIFFNNLLGLVPIFPGGANLTGNIAVTGVLAIFTFVITTFSGNKNYWVHIVNTPGVPWWLKIPIPLMPIVELMGVFTKPFVLMVRLFANITAGHIIVLGFMSLIFIFGNISPGIGYGVSVVSIAFAVFMGLLEILVAFIQAYVFTLLSALYFGMATEEHH